MVTINPLRGGIGALPTAPTRQTPAGTELSKAVVLERDGGRKEGHQHAKGESDADDSTPQEQQTKDYPAYNPHAGLTPDIVANQPLDVVA